MKLGQIKDKMVNSWLISKHALYEVDYKLRYERFKSQEPHKGQRIKKNQEEPSMDQQNHLKEQSDHKQTNRDHGSGPGV